MAAQSADFQPIFNELRAILKKHGAKLVVVHDNAANYYLDTPPTAMMKGKPCFFGAAQIRKSYVSYYLMPVYMFPDLLEGISPELRKRMQGKSCFNFKTLEPDLFKELTELTKASFTRMKKEKYLA